VILWVVIPNEVRNLLSLEFGKQQIPRANSGARNDNLWVYTLAGTASFAESVAA
jgi:hypothetical protein